MQANWDNSDHLRLLLFLLNPAHRSEHQRFQNTLYIDDLRINDWLSILRSSILSISTIYIDDPNISQSYDFEVPIICCAHYCSGHLGSALRPN